MFIVRQDGISFIQIKEFWFVGFQTEDTLQASKIKLFCKYFLNSSPTCGFNSKFRLKSQFTYRIPKQYKDCLKLLLSVFYYTY